MRVAHAAIGIYLVSMALPAIWDNDSVIIGFMAAYFSVFGIPSAIPHVFDGGESTAIVLGGFANGLFVFTYFALLLRRYSSITRPAQKTCAITASTALVAAVTSIIPLLFVTETSTTILGIETVTETTYRTTIGFYVWAGAVALLTFHSLRTVTSAQTGDENDK
jgi:hypothetical protein